MKQLDTKRGAYFSSGYEYPERYSRWDVATLAPPIEIVGRERTLAVNALNERGKMLLRVFEPLFREHNHWDCDPATDDSLHLRLKPLAERFSEEERSKQPSPFSLVRLLVQEFGNAADSRLMLTGAFGYDLVAAVRSDYSSICRGTRRRRCTCFFAMTFTLWIARKR